MSGASTKVAPQTWQAALAQTLGVEVWRLADEVGARARSRAGEIHGWLRLGAELDKGTCSDVAAALAFALAGHGKNPPRLPVPPAKPIAIVSNAANWQLDVSARLGISVTPRPVPTTIRQEEAERLRIARDRRKLVPELDHADLARLASHDADLVHQREKRREAIQDRHASIQELPSDIGDVNAAVAAVALSVKNAASEPPRTTSYNPDVTTGSVLRARLLREKNNEAYDSALLDLDAKIKAEVIVRRRVAEDAIQATYRRTIERVDEVLEALWGDEKSSLRWLWTRELALVLREQPTLFSDPEARRPEVAAYAIDWLAKRGVDLGLTS